MNGFTRTLTIGTIDTGYRTRAVVTVEIEWTPPGSYRFGQVKPDGCLSFTGTYKRPLGRDIDAGGQLQDDLLSVLADIDYADGWDSEQLHTLLVTWKTWHLNDMQAGCRHQRAWGWTYDEHPSEECGVCGYRMGSEWRSMPVPADVINYLRGLPA